jgi:hypothetical protein
MTLPDAASVCEVLVDDEGEACVLWLVSAVKKAKVASGADL